MANIFTIFLRPTVGRHGWSQPSQTGGKTKPAAPGRLPSPLFYPCCESAHLVQLEAGSYTREFIGSKQNMVRGKALWIVWTGIVLLTSAGLCWLTSSSDTALNVPIYQHFNMKRHVSIIVFHFQLVLFLPLFPWDDIIGSLLVRLLSLSLTGPTCIFSPCDSIGAVN